MKRTRDPLDVVVCPGCGRTWQRRSILRRMRPGFPFECTSGACGYEFTVEAPPSIRGMLAGCGLDRSLRHAADVNVPVLVRRVARLLEAAEPERDRVVYLARMVASRMRAGENLPHGLSAEFAEACQRYERRLADRPRRR